MAQETIQVRLPARVHRELKRQAGVSQMPMTEYLAWLLAQHVDGRPVPAPEPEPTPVAVKRVPEANGAEVRRVEEPVIVDLPRYQLW